MIVSNKKGVIALDIDGTLTTHHHIIDREVKDVLISAHRAGWQLIFLTGRTLSFARPILSQLPFSFYCALQNGAIVVNFPDETLVEENTISLHLLVSLQEILEEEKVPFILETGPQNQDQAYYLANVFPKQEEDYLLFRKAISPEKWIAVTSFEEIHTLFVLKFFAGRSEVRKIADRLLNLFPKQLSVIPISDPFREGRFLAHVTDAKATKGQVLKRLLQNSHSKPLIVAGDDYNDLEMLQAADVKIVMNTAPQELQKIADILAPSAEEQGIVSALNKVMQDYGRQN